MESKKVKGTACAFPVWRANEESLACCMAPRLRLVWRRGGPLAPGVGEGQVNLDSGHGQSLQSFVGDSDFDGSN